MILTEDKTKKIQNLIDKVYKENLNDNFLAENTSLICEILDSHYFATIIFPNKYSDQNVYSSNNPEEFNNVYSELMNKDILLDTLIEQNSIVQFTDVVKMDKPGKKEFFGELQMIRPVSDCIYAPIKNNGRICGLTAIARDGLDNKIYDSNDLEIFQFVSHFINEGFIRSLKLPTPAGNQAILDLNGKILSAGDSLKEIFVNIFGVKSWEIPFSGTPNSSDIFEKGYKKFTSNIIQPGSSILQFNFNNKYYILEFKNIKSSYYNSETSGVPCIEITLKENILKENTVLDLEKAKLKYGFTTREIQIIDQIYKGAGNRDISILFNIKESTVKNHVWNIFNKAGVDSRTSLIFILN